MQTVNCSTAKRKNSRTFAGTHLLCARNWINEESCEYDQFGWRCYRRKSHLLAKNVCVRRMCDIHHSADADADADFADIQWIFAMKLIKNPYAIWAQQFCVCVSLAWWIGCQTIRQNDGGKTKNTKQKNKTKMLCGNMRRLCINLITWYAQKRSRTQGERHSGSFVCKSIFCL